MATLTKELKRVFGEEMPGSEFLPEKVPPRLAGILKWKGFAEMEPIDRQRKIRMAIQQLSETQQMELSMILAFTPEEYDRMTRYGSEAG